LVYIDPGDTNHARAAFGHVTANRQSQLSTLTEGILS
jgi:hypothetical protein